MKNLDKQTQQKIAKLDKKMAILKTIGIVYFVTIIVLLITYANI